MESEKEAVESFASVGRLLEDALLLLSRDGEIRWANEACTRLLATPLDGLVGRPLERFASEDVQVLLQRASRSTRFLPGSLTLVTGSGRVLACRCDGALYKAAPLPMLVALRLRPKEQASSEFLALREKIRELSIQIAARKRAEEQERRLGERFKVTLESIGDAVIATDRAGLVTFMNDVAERLTGWTAADAVGGHLDQVFSILNEQTREIVESPVAKVLRHGEVVGLANHTVLVRRDGSELPIDDSGAPIKGGSGAIEGVVLVFRDLSDRYALERELRGKTERLQEADRRKNEYLSMLAHELRNPLAPIRNGIEVLKRGADDATASRVLGLMSRQLSHMVRLIDDLLDISRITQGKFELRLGDVRLPDLFASAQEMTRPQFEAAGVQLLVQPGAADLVLHGDAVRLVQLLSNLLSNAAKFSSPSQAVRLGVRMLPGWVEIWVADEGAGIPADHLEQVFDLFFQGRQGFGAQGGGLGVGLTIARSIAAMHGGTLRVASAGPGQGSTFTLGLPLGA